MPAALEFAVPAHPEDLEAAVAGRLYVHAVLDVENCADVDAVIDGASRGARAGQPEKAVPAK
jgi:hypothetical protein